MGEPKQKPADISTQKSRIRQDYRVRVRELKRLQKEELNELKALRDERISQLNLSGENPQRLPGLADDADLSWSKVDNSAIMYPITTEDSVSNVFRVSITLDEPVRGEILQEALDIVLPKFELFNQRLRQGIFWYYFEENDKIPPRFC